MAQELRNPDASLRVLPHMFSLLAATGPDDSYRDQLMLYGQFVGSWDLEAVFYEDGKFRRKTGGEWHFGWILGGRGVQDVLFRAGAPRGEFGTAIRCYDPAEDVWHISWMQPSGREFVHLIGRRRDEMIVQEVTGLEPGRRERWCFTNITPNSFHWFDEVSNDNGATWIVQEEINARRRPTRAKVH